MFELSAGEKCEDCGREGGDGSVWMGKDLCLTETKMFYDCF